MLGAKVTLVGCVMFLIGIAALMKLVALDAASLNISPIRAFWQTGFGYWAANEIVWMMPGGLAIMFYGSHLISKKRKTAV